MLSWLRKLVRRTPRRDDPTFGSLLYMGDYWEGAGRFPPTGDDVEYFVVADASGPTAANHEALRSICASYPQLLAAARVLIAETEAGAVRLGALVVSSLDVPAIPIDGAVWELTFSGPNDVLYAVEFRGLAPTGFVDVSR